MPKVSCSLKNSVRRRAHNTCEKCGTNIRRNKAGFHNGSIHHRKPRRMGGKDTISNLVLLCLTCHREVHRNEFLASVTGWISWFDPEMTPLLLASGGWSLLVPDGTFEYLSHLEGEHLCVLVNSGALAG
jgi:hypothetical protein